MKRWANRWLQICKEPTWWCVAVLFLVLTAPLSLSSKTDFDYVRDETPYSIRSVRQISENWPFLNVQEQSLSPSAPGYYWFLAGVSKIIGYDVLALRMVNLSISLVGLMILFEWLHRRVAALDAALLIAPLAASNFYVKCAAWVYPENPATILAMLAVLLTLDGHTGSKSAVAAGLYGGMATFTRQLHVWTAAPIFCRALVIRWCATADKRLHRRYLVWAAASCFPILIVAGLYSAWGGIVPPQWNRLYVGSISPVPIAYILSITTLLGSFYYALYPGAVAIRSALWVPALALGVGLAASAPTTYGRIFGHWGGYLWELVRILPAPLDRSIVFMLLAPIGVVLVIGFYRGIRAMGHHQQALTWLISILAWSASFLPNRLIYQRYYEPMILIFCALAVAMSATIKLGNGQRLLLLALTVIQVAITFATAWWRTFLT